MKEGIKVISAPVNIVFKDNTRATGTAQYYNNKQGTKSYTKILCDEQDVTKSVKSISYTHEFYTKGWLTPEIEALGIKVKKRVEAKYG